MKLPVSISLLKTKKFVQVEKLFECVFIRLLYKQGWPNVFGKFSPGFLKFL